MTSSKSDNYRALKLQTSGEKAIKDVIDVMVRYQLFEMCYAYKYRVKPEKKLMEKVLRKRELKPQYALESVTDVVGLRLVTIFRAEMVDVVEKVLRLIFHKDGITQNPFIKGSLEEITYYCSNDYDHLIPAIEGVVYPLVDAGVMTVKTSPQGYSSIHLVARLNTGVEDFSEEDTHYVPIEIQVRTVFEDAWGEIDHRYRYVIHEGKETGKPIHNPEYVGAHLQALKKFTDACAEYADTIHYEATAVRPLVSSGRIISVDADEELITRFRELEVNNKYIQSYLDLRKKKGKAQQVIDGDYVSGVQLFLRTAEGFQELGNSIVADGLEDHDKLIYLYTRLNEAVCLLSVDTRDEIVMALRVYEDLEPDYDRFPLVKMRIGQAYGKIGQTDKAIEKLSEAKNVLSTYGLSCDSTAWPDEVPRVDFEHMAQFLPRLLGYQYWRKSEEVQLSDRNQCLEMLVAAYSETEKSLACGYADEINQRRTFNNLVYYAVSYLNYCGGQKGDTFAAKVKKELSDYLSRLERMADMQHCDDWELLDTFVDAYGYTGAKSKRQKVAKRLLDVALSGDVSQRGLTPELRTQLAEKAYKLLMQDAKA